MNKRVPLPEGFVRGKSYEYGIDVNLAPRGEEKIWQPLRRMFGYQPNETPTTSDSRTYDDLGAQNNSVDAWSFGASVSTHVNRSRTTGEYLPEIEALLDRIRPSALDEDAEIEIREYHKPAKGAPNLRDARQGYVTVARQRGQTGADGQTETWNWTFTGVGSATEIENPWGGWDGDAPLVSHVDPISGPAAELVTLRGTGFKDGLGAVLVTGADGVKFGGANAVDYTVVNATTIVALVPAGADGPAPITVKTVNGTSTARPFTRTA
ncbi:IPT/TIG domain-containing protein [Microbacterium plantarum]|uniref:IPT/TIG domain-containing protein n=1 Tax=Microbacterium plantarum TaxID=1816425 RepID=UPI002B48DD8B|nr:IPT/TIG domain-containing protein [Microbacterium plantarum]WRK16117.1 IPT/TIG domain-containing protein [Microbacterium plantarum]